MNQSLAQNSKLILAAMIFAVSMTFIDQTIVNGYLLSLSALFAFVVSLVGMPAGKAEEAPKSGAPAA
jgi:hypothetical protein